MPSGVIHDRITIWLLPLVAGGTYGLTYSAGSDRCAELTLILAGGYLFSGMMFGPDLDIRSIQYKRWGIIRWIWLPYRKMLRHRSSWSHGFIIGTCVRLLYLSLILAWFGIFLVAIAQICWGFDWNWQEFVRGIFYLSVQKYPREMMALFVGLEIGAMSHSLSDWFSSRHKQKSKRRNSKIKKRLKPQRKIKIYQKKS